MKDDKLNSLLDAFERFLGVVDTPPTFVTQATHQIDHCECSGNFPSLADPDAEVYTVAELLARHERGLLTNMNIGKDVAYPQRAYLNDVDMESIMRLDPVDKFHLANQLENDPAFVKFKQDEAVAREKADKDKEDAAFRARVEAEGWVKPSEEKGGEGKTKVVP